METIMTFEFLIETIEVVGTLLVAWAALRVHHRVLNEHRIDAIVFTTMRLEQYLGVLGMVLIFIGYALSLMY